MKNFSALLAAVLACSVASVLGQQITIAAPAPSATLSPGQDVTVELDTHSTIAQIAQVSVCIGLADQHTVPGQLGSTLLTCQLYNPVQHNDGKPFYQNYTVTIPSGYQQGPTLINVVHHFLAGAEYGSTLEYKNVSVVIG